MSILPVIRDILIILVALESLVMFALAIWVVWQFYGLYKTLRTQVPPIFSTAKQTAGTVEGTVTFVSQRAITPVIRAASITAAVVRFLQVLVRGPGPRRP